MRKENSPGETPEWMTPEYRRKRMTQEHSGSIRDENGNWVPLNPNRPPVTVPPSPIGAPPERFKGGQGKV